MKPSTFAQMPGEALDDFFRRHLERIADPKQREKSAGPARLDHLPVPDGEAVSDHVFLTELARSPMLAYAMAERAEEPRVASRKLSAGAHTSMLLGSRAKTPRAKLRILYAIVTPPIETAPSKGCCKECAGPSAVLPARATMNVNGRNQFAHSILNVILRLLLLPLLLPATSAGQSTPPTWQSAVNSCQAGFHKPVRDAGPPGGFSEAPDDLMDHTFSGLHTELPFFAANSIAVIETNAPGYRWPLNPEERQRHAAWISFLLMLENVRVNGLPGYTRGSWYAFVAAKAPSLPESQIDDIAQYWWRTMGEKAVTKDVNGVTHPATWEEVRAQFRVLRIGSEAEADGARVWLLSAEVGESGRNLVLPREVQDASPLAIALANDIANETRIYGEQQSQKLRTAVECLVADKFDWPEPTAANAHVTRRISVADVDAVFVQLNTWHVVRAQGARDRLEAWLVKALATDLGKPPQARPADPAARSH